MSRRSKPVSVLIAPAAVRAGSNAAAVQHANGISALADAGGPPHQPSSGAAGEAPSARQPSEGVDGEAAVPAQPGEAPAVRCGLADVEALLGHLDRAPEPWRAATRSACEALHAAILEASSITVRM